METAKCVINCIETGEEIVQNQTKEKYEKLSYETVELVEEETITLSCWKSVPSSC